MSVDRSMTSLCRSNWAYRPQDLQRYGLQDRGPTVVDPAIPPSTLSLSDAQESGDPLVLALWAGRLSKGAQFRR